MTPEEAERMLIEWATTVRDRDMLVRSAIAAGVTKQRVRDLTGISRTTIDKILAAGASR